MNYFLHVNDQFTKQLERERCYALNVNVWQQNSSFWQTELTIISELGTKKPFLLNTESNPKSYPGKCMRKKCVNAFKGFLSSVAAR